MQAAQEAAEALWQAENYLRLAVANLATAMARGADAERELGLSPCVAATTQGHVAAALGAMCGGQVEISKAHKSADRILKAYDVVIRAGSGGTKGGSDASDTDSVWNPFGGMMGAASLPTPSAPALQGSEQEHQPDARH